MRLSLTLSDFSSMLSSSASTASANAQPRSWASIAAAPRTPVSAVTAALFSDTTKRINTKLLTITETEIKFGLTEEVFNKVNELPRLQLRGPVPPRMATLGEMFCVPKFGINDHCECTCTFRNFRNYQVERFRSGMGPKPDQMPFDCFGCHCWNCIRTTNISDAERIRQCIRTDREFVYGSGRRITASLTGFKNMARCFGEYLPEEIAMRICLSAHFPGNYLMFTMPTPMRRYVVMNHPEVSEGYWPMNDLELIKNLDKMYPEVLRDTSAPTSIEDLFQSTYDGTERTAIYKMMEWALKGFVDCSRDVIEWLYEKMHQKSRIHHILGKIQIGRKITTNIEVVRWLLDLVAFNEQFFRIIVFTMIRVKMRDGLDYAYSIMDKDIIHSPAWHGPNETIKGLLDFGDREFVWWFVNRLDITIDEDWVRQVIYAGNLVLLRRFVERSPEVVEVMRQHIDEYTNNSLVNHKMDILRYLHIDLGLGVGSRLNAGLVRMFIQQNDENVFHQATMRGFEANETHLICALSYDHPKMLKYFYKYHKMDIDISLITNAYGRKALNCYKYLCLLMGEHEYDNRNFWSKIMEIVKREYLDREGFGGFTIDFADHIAKLKGKSNHIPFYVFLHEMKLMIEVFPEKFIDFAFMLEMLEKHEFSRVQIGIIYHHMTEYQKVRENTNHTYDLLKNDYQQFEIMKANYQFEKRREMRNQQVNLSFKSKPRIVKFGDVLAKVTELSGKFANFQVIKNKLGCIDMFMDFAPHCSRSDTHFTKK